MTQEAKEAAKMVAARIKEIKDKLAEVKPLYDELDALTVSLADMKIEAVEDVDGNGTDVKVVDNFMNKNTVFRPCGVKRFEVEIVTMEDKIKAAEKANKKAKKGA